MITITTPKTFPLHTGAFWAAYFVQMRPYLLFVSGIAGLAGIAMAYDGTRAETTVLVAFVPFFMGYGFGQALTDCFQTDTDKLSAPYRPLSKGIVRINDVLGVSIAGLVGCGLVLLFLHWLSFVLSLVAVFGLATYSVVKKNYWIGGPFYNGWIVALLPLMGYLAIKPGPGFLVSATVWPYIALTFFSYASFVLIGYLKDIDADRATGYQTFPVVWGWQKTVYVGDVFAAATLLLFWTRPLQNEFAVIAGALASVIILLGQLSAHLTKQPNEKGALLAIVSTVRSFLLFHIAIVLHFQPQWLYGTIIFYALFEVFLYKRPSRYQV